MNAVKLGIIGCGVIGSEHAKAAAGCEDIELVAVADLVGEKATTLAQRYQVPGVYGEGAELLVDPRVEAVVLAFPTGQRARLVRMALEMEKHVLVEKPAAMDAAELRGLLAEVRAGTVAACASSRFRAMPSAAAAKSFLDSGELGDVQLVRVRCLKPAGAKPLSLPPDWRLSHELNGGGILLNWGVYDLDYVMGLLRWNLRPVSVTAQCWGVPEAYRSHVTANSDAESHYVAMVRCAGGETLWVERGEYMPSAHIENAWEIKGARGALRMMMLPEKGKRLVFERADEVRGVVADTIWEGDEDYGTIHAGPVIDFARAIRHGHEPLTTLAQELAIVELSDAIYASSNSGQTVAVK